MFYPKALCEGIIEEDATTMSGPAIVDLVDKSEDGGGGKRRDGGKGEGEGEGDGDGESDSKDMGKGDEDNDETNDYLRTKLAAALKRAQKAETEVSKLRKRLAMLTLDDD